MSLLAPAAIMYDIQTYGYIAMFVLAVLEGPIIMILGGFFIRLGFISFWPAYLLLMAGDLCADVLWYGLGYYGARPLTRKYGKFFGLTEELLDKTESVFKRHEGKILFLSKITMGFGFALAVLVTAGMNKVSFKKYLTINFFGQFIWTGFLIVVGYFFGGIYMGLSSKIRDIFVVIFFGGIILGFSLLRKYLKNKEIQEKLK